MKTINKILLESGYTKESLKQFCKGICNGCGGKGGVDFNKIIEALPNFNNEKGTQLKKDLKLICNIHDLDFYKGGSIIKYIKANLKLAKNIYRITKWTTKFKRIIIAVIVFLGTTIFGFKYFNNN